MTSAAALAQPTAAAVEPVRLNIVTESDVPGAIRSAARHAAAGRPVLCFIRSGTSRALAFRSRPEQNNTLVISPGIMGRFPSHELESVMHRAVEGVMRESESDARRARA